MAACIRNLTACSSRSSSSTAKLIDVVVRDPIKLYYASLGSPRGPVPKGYGCGQPYGRPGPTTMRDHGAAAAGEDDWRAPPVARAFHTPPGGLGGVYAPRRGVNVRVK